MIRASFSPIRSLLGVRTSLNGRAHGVTCVSSLGRRKAFGRSISPEGKPGSAKTVSPANNNGTGESFQPGAVRA